MKFIFKNIILYYRPIQYNQSETAMESTDCAVCCEKFNKTTHAKISCEHSGACSFDACKTCVKTYLLGTTSDLSCMHCNKAWSDKFIAQHLGSTFLRGEYTTHRKELLVQQQISRMPETMAAAESYKQVKLIKEQIKNLTAELKISKDSEYILFDRYKEIKLYTQHPQEEKQKYCKEMDTIIANRYKIKEIIRNLTHDIAVINTGGSVVGEEKKEIRNFIMPCTNDDCRGYLSAKYKCDLCEHYTCSKCFDHIGLSKEDDANPHVCKPENVESAEFIKKQSKPCPCCGTRISKIDGCDQMWCTQCHKAFSWNTGKIVTGVIHNPHFYQYQREQGGVAQRNPEDVVCGGLPTTRDIIMKISQSKLTKDTQYLNNIVLDIHRMQVHFTAMTVTPLRAQVRDEQNYEHERIQYMVQEINRKELATKIIRKDNARKKKLAVLHVCELFITVAIDIFQRILLSENIGSEFAKELEIHVCEYNELRQYCNVNFKEISMLYGVCVPIINAIVRDNWYGALDTSKYNSKGEVDAYISKRDTNRKLVQELKLEKEKERRTFFAIHMAN